MDTSRQSEAVTAAVKGEEWRRGLLGAGGAEIVVFGVTGYTSSN